MIKIYRNTYVEINLDNIINNVKNIIRKYNNYKYYIAMVKSNAYNHGLYIVNTLIENGINYLAVSNLDEALNIRKYNKTIPILCTELIFDEYICTAIKNNVTLTVDSLEYLEKLENYNCKIHIKINTGMNRLGISSKDEFNKMIEYINLNKNIHLEGLYSHFATPGIIDKYYNNQINSFLKITKDIDLNKIDIIHMSSSFSLLNHSKISFCNAIRFGTILYGYDVSLKEEKNYLKKIRNYYLENKYKINNIIKSPNIKLIPSFKIKTYVMKIRYVNKNSLLGYNYILKKDTIVGIIPIGYESNIGTNTKNRYVLIHNKKYKVIGNIEMCMMFIEIDNSIKINDVVTVLGDKITLGYLSRINNKSIHETLISCGSNLNKVYLKNNEIIK